MSIPNAEKRRNFVSNEIRCCQTALVNRLLEDGLFTIDQIHQFPFEDGEIYEWWVVSDHAAKRLRQHGEPILENDYGTWWGRTTTGQSIFMDYVIGEIVS